MPLSPAAPRNLLHLRDIQLRGYTREDGLVDIEAHMTDIRTESFANEDRGGIRAGEPLHDMWMRITVDRDMVIQACEAAMDSTPHHFCAGAAPNVERLVGLRIGPGFIKAAVARINRTEGCTHLRELLQPIATVAYQTFFGIRDQNGVPRGLRPGALNSCYALDENGPVVARARAEEAGE
jgi:hypothetical protein